jgi:hypothetical protein
MRNGEQRRTTRGTAESETPERRVTPLRPVATRARRIRGRATAGTWWHGPGRRRVLGAASLNSTTVYVKGCTPITASAAYALAVEKRDAAPRPRPSEHRDPPFRSRSNVCVACKQAYLSRRCRARTAEMLLPSGTGALNVSTACGKFSGWNPTPHPTGSAPPTSFSSCAARASTTCRKRRWGGAPSTRRPGDRGARQGLATDRRFPLRRRPPTRSILATPAPSCRCRRWRSTRRRAR